MNRFIRTQLAPPNQQFDESWGRLFRIFKGESERFEPGKITTPVERAAFNRAAEAVDQGNNSQAEEILVSEALRKLIEKLSDKGEAGKIKKAVQSKGEAHLNESVSAQTSVDYPEAGKLNWKNFMAYIDPAKTETYLADVDNADVQNNPRFAQVEAAAQALGLKVAFNVEPFQSDTGSAGLQQGSKANRFPKINLVLTPA